MEEVHITYLDNGTLVFVVLLLDPPHIVLYVLYTVAVVPSPHGHLEDHISTLDNGDLNREV
jgi:hypothetical protein